MSLYKQGGSKTQSEIWERYCLSFVITYNNEQYKNETNAKMKNKNIRFRMTKARSQGEGLGCIYILSGEALYPSVKLAIILGRTK